MLSGHGNSQNVRRYAPLRSSDLVNGGRADHLTVDKSTLEEKLMEFCGVRRNGTFGLKFYQNKTMDAKAYHSLLQNHALPDLSPCVDPGWSTRPGDRQESVLPGQPVC